MLEIASISFNQIHDDFLALLPALQSESDLSNQFTPKTHYEEFSVRIQRAKNTEDLEEAVGYLRQSVAESNTNAYICMALIYLTGYSSPPPSESRFDIALKLLDTFRELPSEQHKVISLFNTLCNNFEEELGQLKRLVQARYVDLLSKKRSFIHSFKKPKSPEDILTNVLRKEYKRDIAFKEMCINAMGCFNSCNIIANDAFATYIVDHIQENQEYYAIYRSYERLNKKTKKTLFYEEKSKDIREFLGIFAKQLLLEIQEKSVIVPPPNEFSLSKYRLDGDPPPPQSDLELNQQLKAANTTIQQQQEHITQLTNEIKQYQEEFKHMIKVQGATEEELLDVLQMVMQRNMQIVDGRMNTPIEATPIEQPLLWEITEGKPPATIPKEKEWKARSEEYKGLKPEEKVRKYLIDHWTGFEITQTYFDKNSGQNGKAFYGYAYKHGCLWLIPLSKNQKFEESADIAKYYQIFRLFIPPEIKEIWSNDIRNERRMRPYKRKKLK